MYPDSLIKFVPKSLCASKFLRTLTLINCYFFIHRQTNPECCLDKANMCAPLNMKGNGATE